MFFLCGRMPEISGVLIVGMLLATHAQAQHRVPLTLAEAEDLAVAAEPGMVAIRARADAYRESAVAAGQLPDPVLRVGIANFPIESGGFSTEGMTQAHLGVRQAFPRAKSRALMSEQLRSMSVEQDKQAEARSRDVLAATRQSWLETYYWQSAEQVMNESRPFFADLVTITRSMYSVGRKTQHDVLRAELELSRLDDRLIVAQRRRAEGQAVLSRWIGSDAYRPVAKTLPSWYDLPALQALRSQLDEHPLLAAADAGVESSQAAVDLAHESYKPGWALDLGYGYRDGSLANGEPRSDFISLSVSVDLPFFGENRQDRELAAALHERRAARENKVALQARLDSELATEYARWSQLTRRLSLYERQILAQSAGQAKAALLAYQSDAGDFSDVMRGYIDDLDTRLEHIRLKVERARSYAEIARLGGIPR